METPLFIRNLTESLTMLNCGILFSTIHTKQEISSIGCIHFLRYSILFYTTFIQIIYLGIEFVTICNKTFSALFFSKIFLTLSDIKFWAWRSTRMLWMKIKSWHFKNRVVLLSNFLNVWFEKLLKWKTAYATNIFHSFHFSTQFLIILCGLAWDKKKRLQSW